MNLLVPRTACSDERTAFSGPLLGRCVFARSNQLAVLIQSHRVRSAQVTYYKSVVDGSGVNRPKEEALIFEQLVAQDQQLQVSEEMIQRLTSDMSA